MFSGTFLYLRGRSWRVL